MRAIYLAWPLSYLQIVHWENGSVKYLHNKFRDHFVRHNDNMDTGQHVIVIICCIFKEFENISEKGGKGGRSWHRHFQHLTELAMVQEVGLVLTPPFLADSKCQQLNTILSTIHHCSLNNMHTNILHEGNLSGRTNVLCTSCSLGEWFCSLSP